MQEIHKTNALADEIQWFFLAALKGKTPSAHNAEDRRPYGSQKTPVSCGLSEGYPHTDIAHFYIARSTNNDWVQQLINNLRPEFLMLVEEAYRSFTKDVSFERKYAK